jgi:hypothetical protein
VKSALRRPRRTVAGAFLAKARYSDMPHAPQPDLDEFQRVLARIRREMTRPI